MQESHPLEWLMMRYSYIKAQTIQEKFALSWADIRSWETFEQVHGTRAMMFLLQRHGRVSAIPEEVPSKAERLVARNQKAVDLERRRQNQEMAQLKAEGKKRREDAEPMPVDWKEQVRRLKDAQCEQEG